MEDENEITIHSSDSDEGEEMEEGAEEGLNVLWAQRDCFLFKNILLTDYIYIKYFSHWFYGNFLFISKCNCFFPNFRNEIFFKLTDVLILYISKPIKVIILKQAP